MSELTGILGSPLFRKHSSQNTKAPTQFLFRTNFTSLERLICTLTCARNFHLFVNFKKSKYVGLSRQGYNKYIIFRLNHAYLQNTTCISNFETGPREVTHGSFLPNVCLFILVNYFRNVREHGLCIWVRKKRRFLDHI